MLHPRLPIKSLIVIFCDTLMIPETCGWCVGMSIHIQLASILLLTSIACLLLQNEFEEPLTWEDIYKVWQQLLELDAETSVFCCLKWLMVNHAAYSKAQLVALVGYCSRIILKGLIRTFTKSGRLWLQEAVYLFTLFSSWSMV